MVLPSRARDVIRVLKPSAALASRPLSGSSKKMAFGLWRSAAVMTTLCRMPFEYPASSSRRSVASASSKNSAKRRMRAAASPKRLESWRRRITRRPRHRARDGSRLPEHRPSSAAAAGGHPSGVLRALRADEAVLRVGEQHVEGGEAPVRARDVVLELDAVLVGELGVRVDALLEDAQALAHRDDLAEERLDGDDLLLRAGLARLHHELAARPALADRAGHRLLGIQHGAYRLHDLADVLLVERHGAPQRTEATSKARPASTAEEKRWPSANVRPVSKRSPCRVWMRSVRARGSIGQYSCTPFRS